MFKILLLIGCLINLQAIELYMFDYDAKLLYCTKEEIKELHLDIAQNNGVVSFDEKKYGIWRDGKFTACFTIPYLEDTKKDELCLD